MGWKGCTLRVDGLEGGESSLLRMDGLRGENPLSEWVGRGLTPRSDGLEGGIVSGS